MKDSFDVTIGQNSEWLSELTNSVVEKLERPNFLYRRTKKKVSGLLYMAKWSPNKSGTFRNKSH